ncbi:g patch domain containing protein [Holotrichia oblita]|uniref:G patch domain containing protein n=1 Tax=Holotrichia oblita TaxID=644536 RepID=A0ACB9SHU6_HOLOL|nr:g patch domain containing protein [Holotrichia oblita]
MSMLAEPKRKQRWSLNPRGKLWTEDKNNFGHKMLEKMGWKHGKGLGAKENGVTDPLKVSYKNDSKGMGYEEVEEWTAHEDNFSSLLENLNGDEKLPDDPKIMSLETKVQNSRARINYHKFTKAKDLSRYSEKELANIFGRKSLKQNVDNDKLEKVDDIVEAMDDNDHLVNKGSMLDYFKDKLLNRGKSNLEKHTKQESESENERVGFGFTENNNKAAERDEDNVRRTKKKKRKHVDAAAIVKNSETEVVNIERDAENEHIGIEFVEDNPCSSKKKKRKHSEKDATEEDNDNTHIIKKKKRKHLEKDATEEDNDNSQTIKKKERKHIDATINEDCEVVEKPRRKKKDKSTKTDHRKEEENLNVSAGNDNTIEQIQAETEENSRETQVVKKAKKSKKQKVENDDLGGVSNPGFTDKLENEITPEKRKKKKRKHSETLPEGIDNPTFHSKEDSSNVALDCLSPYEVKPKKKKKSKKTEIGLDNPALNLSEVIVDGDLMLNVVNTPVVAEEQVTKKFKPDLNIERVRNNRRKSVRFNDVLEEHIIPNNPSERSNEYISNRNELFDINTMVIEEGIKEEMEKNGVKYERKSVDMGDLNDPKEINRKVVETSVKEELNRGLNPQSGFVNNAFDIRSVDKINFCNDKFELKPSPNGIDNKAFNKTKTEIEENVNSISNKIERYQAEVENNINECKYELSQDSYTGYYSIGDVARISENIRVEEGLKLCFKQANFRTPVPHYHKGGGVALPKKSYRHLIQGDITVTFRSSNLHEIKGYATESNRGRIS